MSESTQDFQSEMEDSNFSIDFYRNLDFEMFDDDSMELSDSIFDHMYENDIINLRSLVYSDNDTFNSFNELNFDYNNLEHSFNVFFHLMNSAQDSTYDPIIQEQREHLMNYILQSPFLNNVYLNVIESSLNEPPQKNPVSDEIFETFPIITMNKELIENNESCVICRENFSVAEHVLILPCNHVYHKDCIKGWFQEQNMCPICRTNV